MDYGFPKEIPQGIITSTLELKSKENSYKLSVDGLAMEHFHRGPSRIS
jgi:hypothetical protein